MSLGLIYNMPSNIYARETGNGIRAKRANVHLCFGDYYPVSFERVSPACENTLLRDCDLCLILSNLFEHTKGKAPDNARV